MVQIVCYNHVLIWITAILNCNFLCLTFSPMLDYLLGWSGMLWMWLAPHLTSHFCSSKSFSETGYTAGGTGRCCCCKLSKIRWPETCEHKYFEIVETVSKSVEYHSGDEAYCVLYSMTGQFDFFCLVMSNINEHAVITWHVDLTGYVVSVTLARLCS